VAESFPRIAFEGVTVLLGEELTPVANTTLVVEEGTLSVVGRGSGEGNTIRMRTGVVLPVLVNAHVHPLDYAIAEAARGLSLTEAVRPPNGVKHRLLRKLSAKERTNAVRQVLERSLACGAAVVVGFYELGLSGVRSGRRGGERLVIEHLVLGRPDGESPEAVLEEADGWGLPSTYGYSDDELRALGELAHKNRKLVMVHVAEDLEEESATRRTYGCSSVERAIEVLGADAVVHGCYASESDFETLAEKGVPLCICPRSNASFGLPLPDIVQAVKKGVTIALGTDNAMVAEPDMLRELEAAAFLYCSYYRSPSAVTADILLKAATLGLQPLRLGSPVREGEKPSFLLMRFDSEWLVSPERVKKSIVFRSSTARLELMMYRGAVLLASKQVAKRLREAAGS